MRNDKIAYRWIVFLFLALLFSSCSGRLFMRSETTLTATIIPSSTSSKTPTSTPTHAPTASPTTSPTLTPMPIQNIYTGELIPLSSYYATNIYDFALSPDGHWIAVGVDGGILVYDSSDLDAAPRFLGSNMIRTIVEFSPDGKILAGAGRDLTYVYLWNTSDWSQVRNIGMDYGVGIRAMTFASDSTLVSVAASRVGRTSYVQLWNTSNGTLVHTLSAENLLSVALSSDGHTMATGTNDGKVILWNWMTGNQIDSITTDGQYVEDLAFSPDGLILASTSGKYGKRGENLTLWDAVTLKRIRNLPGTESYFESITFSPQGETLAACCYKGNIILWDLITGKSKTELAGAGKIKYLPNGNSLAYAKWTSGWLTVAFWDMLEQREVKHISDNIHGEIPMAFTPDGTAFVAYNISEQRITIRDLMNGLPLNAFGFKAPLPGNGRSKFSPDGSLFVTTSGNQTISLWNSVTWEKVGTFSGVTSDFEIAPDGRTVATLGRELVIWDISTGMQTMTLACGRWMADCEAVAFSPDGKTIIVSSYTLNGNMIKVFEASSGHEIAIFEDHSERVSELFFLPDGRTYVTIDRSAVVTLWDASTYKQIRTFGTRNIGEYGSYRGIPPVFSPNGQVLASAVGDRINIWSVATGKLIYTLYVPETITAFSFVMDGTMLVVGDGSGGAILYWGFAENLSKYPFPISKKLITLPP